MAMLQDLSFWDGRSVDDILKIYENHKNSRSFIDDLVSLIVERIEENGATWLLKHHLEQGVELDSADVNRIYGVLPRLKGWEGRLHILQSIPYMPIHEKNRALVEAFVRDGLDGDHKLIRAWSFNGFYEVAKTFPDLQQEAQAIFEQALETEAASVKARIRNVLKQGFPQAK